MRIVKPNQVGILSRPFEFNNKYGLCVGGLILFPFDEPRYPMTEQTLWVLVGKELGETVLDECMPKPHGEVLLRANAYAPGGSPMGVVRAAVELDGKVIKEIAVSGDRVWDDGAPTDPEPFLSKSITWNNAFGGEGFKLNPLGKGYHAKDGDPLPNLEDPTRLLTSPRQTPDPAGVMPYDLTWPQRMAKAGKYDQKWFDTLYPGLAANIDWTFYNVAPNDQQIAGFFRGDEELVFRNLHPDHPELRCKLPEVKLRCFMRRKQLDGAIAQGEIEMKLDTLWMFPHARHGVLVFHGTIPIREDDASDVELLYMACEDLGQPKLLEHYEKELERRLSKELGAIASLEDVKLMPALRGGMKQPPSPGDEMADKVAMENLGYENQMRGANERVKWARAVLVENGLDPDVHGPPPIEPFDTSGSIEEVIARSEAADKKMEEELRKQEAASLEKEARLELMCNAEGIDFAEIKKEWRGPFKGGPPEPKADKLLGRLRAMKADGLAAGFDVSEIDVYLDNPQFVADFYRADELELENYRLNAQDLTAPSMRTDEESRRLREELVAAHRRGESFAGRDLTGANLAGIQLPSAVFEDALMEGCDLTGANLTGAFMKRVVLVRANLTGARLESANLTRANLSKANCTNASFRESWLSEAILIGTELVGTNLEHVRLHEAIFGDTKLCRCAMGHVQAASVSFDGLDLSDTSFAGANLRDATFMRCVLDRADFTGADMFEATFDACRGTQVVFAKVQGHNLRMVEGTAFIESNFREAELGDACVRGSTLTRSDFTQARAVGADFSECDMRDSQFHHLFARRARFVRTDLSRSKMVGVDLMQGSLSKATVNDVDFSGGNFYLADLSLLRGAGSQFIGAMMVRANIKPFFSDKIQNDVH